jgi:hypothetical protein
MLTLATSYLAGSILTLLIPGGLFIVIGLWHLGVVKRSARRAGEEPPAAAVRGADGPPPQV